MALKSGCILVRLLVFVGRVTVCLPCDAEMIGVNMAKVVKEVVQEKDRLRSWLCLQRREDSSV